MLVEIDKGVGMFQDNVFDVTELGEFVPQIRFVGSSAQLGNVDLGEVLLILVSLVPSIATSASASAV